ncbi:MAG: DUF2207 domain-containing protein [Anaerolineae bacterium]
MIAVQRIIAVLCRDKQGRRTTIRRLVLSLVEGLVLISVCLILVLSVLASLAYAQDRSVVWDRFDVDLSVQKNGDIDVVETQAIVFQGGPFRFGFAAIPFERLEGITNVEVYEGNRRFEQSNSEAPYTFQTWVESGEFNIRWYFPETSDSRHTYVIKYKAEGAVRIYDGGDQIWWIAIGDLGFPVQSSRVMVHLPEGVDEVQNWESYGITSQTDVLDPRTIVFTAQETIRPGRQFEIRVQFPHGVVEAPPPAWQRDYDARVAEQPIEVPPGVEVATDPTRQVIDLLAGFIGLFITAIGTVGLFVLWYTRGRDAPVPLVTDYLPQPPSSLPPGVVGTLLDETADMQDIIASIVDLARRGVITMQEIQEKGFLGIGARRDFVFEMQDHQETLRPYEKMLLKELFGGRHSRKLSALKEKFYRAIPELQDELYGEVVQEGFFLRSPESTRRIYTLLGVVGVILSVIVGFFTLVLLIPFAGAAICIPLGLGIVSVGMVIFARVMPRKTTKGSEAAARWRAFKRYLDNIEDYSDLEQAKDVFDRYLPYAIAFGLEKSWVQKFAQVDAPAPPWYQPAGPAWGEPWPHGPGRRVYRRGGRPVIIGSGGGRGEPAPAPDIGRPGGGMPDLQRTSDSLGRGLQSMSDGLATMLNTAGSILSSVPRSSGGGGFSGGGRTGGGWSGGGGGFSGGGGGSGGGSRGFG